MTMVDSFEKIPVKIFSNLKEGSFFAANQVAALIKEKQALNQPCVLGLATGNTPKAVYKELVRMHKQEGLSFINPEMASSVSFHNGGFQAKYGDKMSSVLDVTYKRPDHFSGSVMASLLGASLHLEGASKNEKFTFLVGVVDVLEAELLAVGEETQEVAGVASAGDDQNFLDTGIHERLDWIENHRPVVDR